MLSLLCRSFGHKRTTSNLFLCHLLSTWNARSYEFASVLFTAAAFPEGLSAASWIGITINVALILFASSLGRWVDHAPYRLQTLLTTITINRIVIIVACSCWVVIIISAVHKSGPQDSESDSPEADPRPLGIGKLKDAVFLMILALGVIERLSRVANLISIERDWVPTLATASISDKESTQYDLTQLNAIMSRIDLVCKLGAPIMMSMFMSVATSTWPGAVALIALNLISWPVEFWTARSVWHENISLQEIKTANLVAVAAPGTDGAHSEDFEHHRRPLDVWLRDSALAAVTVLMTWVHNYISSLRLYLATDVWMPSLAMSGLHYSVLVFSGTLTVFLVNSGFSLKSITWAEVLSAAFEIGSTYVFPWGVRTLSAKGNAYYPLSSDELHSVPGSPSWQTLEILDDDQPADRLSYEQNQRRGTSRLGMLALGLMLLCLVPVVPAIWQISMRWPIVDKISSASDRQASAWETNRLVTICIILFVSMSRLGRWTGSLCAQQLAQSCVQPEERSMFAGTEASLASTFGLGHWIATVIWSRHQEFRWIALSSLLVTVFSTSLYALWLARKARPIIT